METDTPTLDTPSNDAGTETGDDFDMMKFAASLDAGETHEASTAKATGSKPAADTKPIADKSGATADTAAGKKGTQEAPKENAKPGEKGAEPKPESDYTKAQKEQARQQNLLKNFQQEKEQFRQERDAHMAELKGLREQVSKLTRTAAGPAKDGNGITAEQYDRAAKSYAEKGEDDMAALARERAEALRRQTPAAETSTAPASNPDEAWKAPEFQKKWDATTNEILAAEPALADPKNPVFAAVNNLVNDKTWGAFFRARPDGIRAAVEVAKLLQTSARADALQKELETTKGEIERLTKLTQPRGSRPAAPLQGEKTLSEMTEAEADAHVRRIAAQADGLG